ncbi:MAG: hypothetical protein R6U43_11135, partial [Candidatus Krumholzibacteriales bacterium]
MKKLLICILFFSFISLTCSFQYNNLEIPRLEPSDEINYSLIPTVNNSLYWDGQPISYLDDFFKLDQTTPQSVDFGDGTGLSFDTVDLVGGGAGVFPRMKFTNSNVAGFPQDLGLIDKGLVIQDDDNEPLLAFA